MDNKCLCYSFSAALYAFLLSLGYYRCCSLVEGDHSDCQGEQVGVILAEVVDVEKPFTEQMGVMFLKDNPVSYSCVSYFSRHVHGLDCEDTNTTKRLVGRLCEGDYPACYCHNCESKDTKC